MRDNFYIKLLLKDESAFVLLETMNLPILCLEVWLHLPAAIVKETVFGWNETDDSASTIERDFVGSGPELLWANVSHEVAHSWMQGNTLPRNCVRLTRLKNHAR